MAKRICFVGLDNYPVLNPDKGNEYFGGEAVQQTLLAKMFRDLGYDVSMVDRDFGQPDGQVIDGITVWKTMREGDGLPGLRFFHPRLTSVYRALRNADADIYYQSCAGIMTGIVAWFCNRYNRQFVFRIAHDTDCIPGRHLLSRFYRRDAWVYLYGLHRAHVIAAQSRIQQELLQQNFKLPSQVVNMAVQPPNQDGRFDRDIDVLWVNNIRAFKRPELVFEIARRMPNVRFVMIGGPISGSEQFYSQIENLANETKNIDFLGPVPYSEVNSYFSRAKVFINTSDSEGFPNSFVQAWIHGVPVISFFDPDFTIEQQGLGAAPKSIDDMVISINRFLSDPIILGQVSSVARRYAMQHFSAAKIAGHYISIIESDIGFSRTQSVAC